MLIAADGGARHCVSLNLVPQIVIGDFDSLSAKELSALESAGTQIIRHSTRKDETDLELALHKAQEYQPQEILIFGALGARWDMTLANLLLLAHPAFTATNTRLLDGPQEIRLLQSGQTASLIGKPGDTVSLIPLQGDAYGITTNGLEYPLKNETLKFGATRGISNVIEAEDATIQLRQGLLLIIHIHVS
jgi:thiamine pyrophosphokinase